MFNRHSKDISILHRLSYIVMNDSSSNPSFFLRVRCISKTSSDPSQSFVVSYLKEKLGFSPESAMTACRYLFFKTPDKPDSVIAFLEKHGFSKTQIKKIIAIRPDLLYSNAEKTLLPKLEFFQSKGFSSPELIKILFYNPTILTYSLDKKIVPRFNQLSNLLQSDSKATTAIKRHPLLFSCQLDAYLLPNISILRDNGVPESNIISMFTHHPKSFVLNPDRFKEIVKKVKEMGFNPLLLKFILAVIVFRKVSKPAMERKFDVYKKWGWSELEIWEAFRRYPNVMETSEEKIVAIMDFLVNKMGFQSLLIANQPSVFGRSFEKRIVPRGLFAQDLLSKGLIKNLGFSTLFDTSEKVFVRRFVNKYECKAPELLMLYKEKQDLAIGGKYRSG
ncbi:transcription termination factor MTERF6, chloroplastic/mitochondrial-like [Durio zibethinus]|uniref:Transcription termination factor MTERF6, chloroplastic/mitochondrial-like n=1 Tax=Durio zibethinus TaxID=66656 RepID=A0A6P5X0R5_DURZI|nr:transcription termination factor MTERF6, chloroplastic/mitochondrial-like [Durio zibethinus]